MHPVSLTRCVVHLRVQVYKSATDEYVFYDKEYKRSLSMNGAIEGGVHLHALGSDGIYTVPYVVQVCCLTTDLSCLSYVCLH